MAAVVFSLEGRILSWNRGAERIYGYAERDVLDTPVERIVPRESRRAFFHAVRRLTAGRPVETFRSKRIKRSGEVVDVQETMRLLRDGTGRPVAVSSEADMAPRGLSEGAAFPSARAEGTFHRLEKRAVDHGVFTIDRDGSILTWERGMEKMSGYRLGDVLTRHFSLLYAEPDRRAGVPESELRFAAEQGGLVVDGWRLRRDGTRFWARVVTAPLPSVGGGNGGYSYLVSDLSAERVKRQAAVHGESRLNALVNSALNPVAIVDRRGVITYTNDSVERVFGFSSAECAGRNIMDFVHPGDVALVLDAFTKIVETATPRPVEFRVRHKPGGWRQVEAGGLNRLRDPRLRGIVVTIRDLTSERRLEADFFRGGAVERRRVAESLHDGLLQQLAGVEFMARVLEEKLRGRGVAEALTANQIAEYLNRAISSARRISYELYPIGIETGGLFLAIEVLVDDLARTGGVVGRVRGDVAIADPCRARDFFFIIRELILEGIAVFGARTMEIELSQRDGVSAILIRHDGRFRAPPDAPDEGAHLADHRARLVNAKIERSWSAAGGAIRVVAAAAATEEEEDAPVER